MKLYYAPGACSMAPHIVLNELHIDHAIVKVDLKTHTTSDGRDYYKINPKGYVPALELENGAILTENIAILTYLVESAADGSLEGDIDSVNHYRQLEWLAFVSTEVHKTLGMLWDPTLPSAAADAVKKKAAARFDYLDKELAGRSFLTSDTFSAAPDAYLFTVLSWSVPLKLDMSRWTNILAYLERVRNRPAVQQTMAEEGLLAAAGQK